MECGATQLCQDHITCQEPPVNLFLPCDILLLEKKKNLFKRKVLVDAR